MREIGIYVFSGTGNTLKCARELHSALLDLGEAARLLEIGDGSETASERELVLCYPIHGFNAPASVIRFCRGLPQNGGRVWFLKSSGEPLRLNEASSTELIRILKKKGYQIQGEYHFVMPYNMVFRHSDEMASLMWQTARERIPAAARQIAEGGGEPIRAALPARLMSALCRIEHGFYPLNGRLYRVDESKCLRCMQCVQSCPVNNIRLEKGKLRFGWRCIGCARCSFRCPGKAIHIGILDFMRVCGPYNFTRDPGKARLGRYCRKAYERYFAEKED